jgi:predicted nucleic acid-binding protein
VSTDILFEYKEVLLRKTNNAIAENILSFISSNPFTQKIDIFFNFHLITTDESDNKFVDCAIASGAICIISNDHHFNILKLIDFPKVNVLKLFEFDDEYREKYIFN